LLNEAAPRQKKSWRKQDAKAGRFSFTPTPGCVPLAKEKHDERIRGIPF